MGRLIALTAFTLLALAAAPAGAAELTRVPSAGEPDNPIDLDLSVSFVRTQRGGSISRELATAVAGQPFPTIRDLRQLRYSETTNSLVPRLAVGLWQDLGLSMELPVILGRDATWRRGSGVGTAADLPDTISGNTLTPNGGACASLPCPIFAVATVYHGASLGDFKVGLDYGIYSDRRDDTLPFWLVGLELTFPTAKLYDPGARRNANWELPATYYTTSSSAPLGQKVWKYDFHTALSRRMGVIDPYLRVHLTLQQKSSGTPSNCDHAQALVDAGQAVSGAVALCQANPDKWGARLPYLAGLTFGSEVILDEDRVAGRRIAIDLRLSGEYTSWARWYNELSDATGKLLATEAHLTAMARVGFLFRASDYVSVQFAAAYGYATPHDLSGESPGGTTVTNPNFDWRYDAPGRRFRLSEATILDLAASFMLHF
jgi:hypothetical protein